MSDSATQFISEDKLDQRVRELAILRAYTEAEYLSIKYSSYFDAYEELLSRYRGKPIVFIEVGVFHGGSLFMWRKFFGPDARIIGIDLNPAAKKWEKYGFEIYIGNQADPDFWDGLFKLTGDVDVVLDDGGHANDQQIVTAVHCVPHIRDGGAMIVEDTHTSYFPRFGNPSNRSFISFAKTLIDSINARSPVARAKPSPLNRFIWSAAFYESMVCFHVDRRKCFVSELISNRGATDEAVDFRYEDSALDKAIAKLNERAPRKGLLGRASAKFFGLAHYASSRLRSRKLAKYFQPGPNRTPAR